MWGALYFLCQGHNMLALTSSLSSGFSSMRVGFLRSIWTPCIPRKVSRNKMKTRMGQTLSVG